MITEAAFKRHLIASMTSRGYFARALNDRLTKGLPDLFFCRGGGTGWLEIKRLDPLVALPAYVTFVYRRRSRPEGGATAPVEVEDDVQALTMTSLMRSSAYARYMVFSDARRVTVVDPLKALIGLRENLKVLVEWEEIETWMSKLPF